MSSEIKLCRDCIHFRELNPSTGSPMVDALRSHFGLVDKVAGCGALLETDPVDGGRLYRSCRFMRSENGKCGPAAAFYQSRAELDRATMGNDPKTN